MPDGVVQHDRWSGKHCPRVLRDKPNGWRDFLKMAADFAADLHDVTSPDIDGGHDHHEEGQGSGGAAGAEEFVVIAKDGLRVRAGPGTDFEVKSSLPFGARVVVISRSGEWAMVDVDGGGSGGDGFVHSAFLRRDVSAARKPSPAARERTMIRGLTAGLFASSLLAFAAGADTLATRDMPVRIELHPLQTLTLRISSSSPATRPAPRRRRSAASCRSRRARAGCRW